MTSKYIDINGRWGVVLCYNLYRKDVRDMRAYMESFGMEDENIDEALRVLLYHENTGMCVSSFALRMSLVFIGGSSDEGQFWDTVSHELYHVMTAICDYYDVSSGSEDAAWTMGYLVRKTVQQIAPP